MLHRLIEYADAHQLDCKEGFTSKQIRFLIIFSPEGQFLSIHDYGSQGEKFSPVPHLQFSGDKPERQFLVDTLDFTVLYPPFEESNFVQAVTHLKEKSTRLLDTLKNENDFREIQQLSNQIFTMLEEKKFLEMREKDLKKEWTNRLKKCGRASLPEIKDVLKKDGVVDAVFNNQEFKRRGKHQYYIRLLNEASAVVPCFRMIAKALSNPSVIEQIHKQLDKTTPAAKNSNNATIAVLENDQLKIVVKEDVWHDWWISKHQELSDNLGPAKARCFLSGKQVKPLLTHPKIKGLGMVGGTADNQPITSRATPPISRDPNYILVYQGYSS